MTSSQECLTTSGLSGRVLEKRLKVWPALVAVLLCTILQQPSGSKEGKTLKALQFNIKTHQNSMSTTFVGPPKSCGAMGGFFCLFVCFFFQIMPFKNHGKHRVLSFVSFILAYNVEKVQKFKAVIN